MSLLTLLRRRDRILNLTATTASDGQTVTIQQLTPTGGSLRVYWGDGATSFITNGYTGTITHVYAAAGVYGIQVMGAQRITAVDLRDAKLGGLNTAQLRGNRITYWYVKTITGSTIRSADMVAWRPSSWCLYSLPAGTYNIASADMTAWRPTTWYMFSMPAGTYNISSADMTAWRPSNWVLFSMPAGTYTFAAACMRTWAAATEIRCDGLGLSQATVNAILYDIYAGFADRTGTGGTINVGGSNAAPSGTFQAAASCPVTDATPGKEVAWELLNDTCNVSAKHWTTVTVTA